MVLPPFTSSTALWKSQKQNYALDEETREVNYIYVPIEPSQSDRIEAQQAVEAAVLALNSYTALPLTSGS